MNSFVHGITVTASNALPNLWLLLVLVILSCDVKLKTGIDLPAFNVLVAFLQNFGKTKKRRISWTIDRHCTLSNEQLVYELEISIRHGNREWILLTLKIKVFIHSFIQLYCFSINLLVVQTLSKSFSQALRKHQGAAVILLTSAAHCYATHYLSQNR